MRNRPDPFARLERSDKWSLAGGTASQYAPIFPRFADTPGFWDDAHFAEIRLDCLYTLLLVREDGTPLRLRLASRRWNPSLLTQLYTVEGFPSLQVREERTVSPRDSFATRLTLTNRGNETAHLHWILWSLQTAQRLSDNIPSSTIRSVSAEPDLFLFERVTRSAGIGETPAAVSGWGERPLDSSPPREASLFVALGASRLPDSSGLLSAEPVSPLPLWELSPVSDRFQDGRLQNLPVHPPDLQNLERERQLHLVQHYATEVQPGASDTLTFAASVSPFRESALENLRLDMASDPFLASREDWRAWFDAAPSFECSDPFLETAFLYRVFLLKFHSVRVGIAPLTHPCIFEGISGFRSHVSYASVAVSRDAAFLDPELAEGCLLNLLEAQTQNEDSEADGFVPGHLYLWRRDRGFYHADWGGAALQLFHVTGNRELVRRLTPWLARYAEFLDRERDPENSGLYDVSDQGETGQEYSPRYGFVDENADRWTRFRLKGVEAACYAAGIQRTLAEFSLLLGEREDAAYWKERAETTSASVRELLWSAEADFFVDVHPETGKRSPHKAAVGFYPLLFGIANETQAKALAAHLEPGGCFDAPYPVPTLSRDNSDFSAEGDWKGVRTSCPWNGRVWPMTNAQVISGIVRAGRQFSLSQLRDLAGRLLKSHVRMMFHPGDASRPNAYEHYSPKTGRPALFRGVDDYLHSSLLDLFFGIIAGVVLEPGTPGKLVLDPISLELDRFRFEGIPIRGHRVDVIWSLREGFVVTVDGVERVQLPSIQRVEINL